jgi:hypothetical protein
MTFEAMILARILTLFEQVELRLNELSDNTILFAKTFIKYALVSTNSRLIRVWFNGHPLSDPYSVPSSGYSGTSDNKVNWSAREPHCQMISLSDALRQWKMT